MCYLSAVHLRLEVVHKSNGGKESNLATGSTHSTLNTYLWK